MDGSKVFGQTDERKILGQTFFFWLCLVVLAFIFDGLLVCYGIVHTCYRITVAVLLYFCRCAHLPMYGQIRQDANLLSVLSLA